MFGRTVLRAWVLLLLALGGTGSAQAQNFDFSYRVSGLNVMGTFVTSARSGGQYLITDIINGTRGGDAITLLPPRSLGGSDNLLFYPANPAFFDSSGVSYRSAGLDYNLYFGGGAYREINSNGGPNIIVSDVMVAPAPLPGGGLPSFLALGLFALVSRRRTILARVRVLAARGPDRRAA